MISHTHKTIKIGYHTQTHTYKIKIRISHTHTNLKKSYHTPTHTQKKAYYTHREVIKRISHMHTHKKRISHKHTYKTIKKKDHTQKKDITYTLTKQ